MHAAWIGNGDCSLSGMNLKLNDVKRIAAEVARRENPALEVLSAGPTGEDSAYAELIVTIRGCRAEPCQFLIGVNRDATENAVRHSVLTRLREHLADHAVVAHP